MVLLYNLKVIVFNNSQGKCYRSSIYRMGTDLNRLLTIHPFEASLNFTWFRHHLDPEFHMLHNLCLIQDHILKLLYCIIIIKKSQINCHKNLAYRLICAHYMWTALYDGNIPSIIKSNKSHAHEPWRHRSRTSSHAATFHNHSPQSQIASMQLEVPWTDRQYGAKRLLSLWLGIRAVRNGITSHVGTLLAAASFIVNMTRE